MTAAQPPEYSVLCVDDNPHVAEALRSRFTRVPDCSWLGWLPDAGGLIDAIRNRCPSVVLLDLDMPGLDPFEALARVSDHCPDTKVVIFSGHVRKELVDRAIAAGAWGYISKNDGEEALLAAVHSVLQGDFTLSPEVRSALDY